MDLLDLSAQLGARAFVRAGSVHLRNRFAGEVFCDATEPDSDPPQALADGPTPEEAGLDADKVAEWPWCEECQILGRGAGVIIYATEELPAPVAGRSVEP